MSRFARIVSLVVFAVAAGIVALRVSAGGHRALLVLPPLLGGATWYLLTRLKRDEALPRTAHQYVLAAPAPTRHRFTELVERLAARGYQLDAVTVDELARVGIAPHADARLDDLQLRLRDRRAAAELGEVMLRLRIDHDGAFAGVVEGVDTGPGFYDELAQFTVVELAALIPGLEVAAVGSPAGRRPAGALAAELPARPLGLALLG